LEVWAAKRRIRGLFFGEATPVAMRFVHVYGKCRQLKVALQSLAGLGSYKTEPHFIRPRN
jgi:hypothetical protein